MNDDFALIITLIKLVSPPGKLAQVEAELAPLERKYRAGLAALQPAPPTP